MEKVTRMEVDFGEIFRFAEEKHNVGWNPCNDLFFNTVLDYKRYNDFYQKDLQRDLDYEGELSNYPHGSDDRKAATILLDFMKTHNLSSMRVFND